MIARTGHMSRESSAMWNKFAQRVASNLSLHSAVSEDTAATASASHVGVVLSGSRGDARMLASARSNVSDSPPPCYFGVDLILQMQLSATGTRPTHSRSRSHILPSELPKLAVMYPNGFLGGSRRASQALQYMMRKLSTDQSGLSVLPSPSHVHSDPSSAVSAAAVDRSLTAPTANRRLQGAGLDGASAKLGPGGKSTSSSTVTSPVAAGSTVFVPKRAYAGSNGVDSPGSDDEPYSPTNLTVRPELLSATRTLRAQEEKLAKGARAPRTREYASCAALHLRTHR